MNPFKLAQQIRDAEGITMAAVIEKVEKIRQSDIQTKEDVKQVSQALASLKKEVKAIPLDNEVKKLLKAISEAEKRVLATHSNDVKRLDTKIDTTAKKLRQEIDDKIPDVVTITERVEEIEKGLTDQDYQTILDKVFAESSKLVDSLESLEGEDRLDASAIKNLPQQMQTINAGGGSNLSVFKDGAFVSSSTRLNFTGSGVTVSNEGGRTKVDIASGGSASISDEAYGATWDGVTDEAASKNAIYDKIETLSGGHDPVTVTDSAEIDFTLTGQDITAVLKASSIDETKLDTSVNASLDLADSASQPGHTHTASEVTDFDTEVSNNVTVDANKERSISAMSTGIIFGGALSINSGDTTKIDIAAGAGYVVDDTVTPATITYVEWDAKTAVTLTDLATENNTDIALDSSGNVVQQRSYTNTELRSNIFLGGVDHAGGTVNNVFSIQVPSFGFGTSIRDLSEALGDLNLSGNTYSANGANLNIDKTSGKTFSYGRNTKDNKNDPHTITESAQTALSFNYIFRDGSGGTTVGSSTTSINPLNYDDGSGTLATIPVNDFGFHNILFFPNSGNTFIQYGTTTYNTLDEAINGLASTSFPELPGFTTAVRRGVIIVKRGTTALNDTDDARFFVADKYGSVAGSIGTGADAGGDMLASVYDPTNIADDAFARTNHTGTQTASTISDFDTEVSNNTDVAANTSARHDAVTLAGTPNYLTIAGQVITRALINLTSHVTGILPIANGGTGASTASGAFTNIKQNASTLVTGVVERATDAEFTTGTDTTRYVTADQVASVTQTMTNKTLDDAKIIGSINAQTGTTYTLVLADASKHVTMTNASANTLTVPPNSSVAFEIGTRIMVQQKGAGSTTIAAGSGVTINAPSTVTLAIGEQYESRGLLKTGVDTWELI